MRRTAISIALVCTGCLHSQAQNIEPTYPGVTQALQLHKAWSNCAVAEFKFARAHRVSPDELRTLISVRCSSQDRRWWAFIDQLWRKDDPDAKPYRAMTTAFWKWEFSRYSEMLEELYACDRFDAGSPPDEAKCNSTGTPPPTLEQFGLRSVPHPELMQTRKIPGLEN